MPPSNKLPNSLRYLRGRLRILKRPMVWGSAAAMMLAVLLFSEYWKHPEWFTSSEEYTSTSGVASLDNLPNGQNGAFPSQEDSAIGSDIDSLPVLLNDLNLDNPSEPGQTAATEADPSQAAGLTSTPSTTASPLASPSPGSSQPPRLFNLNLPGVDRANFNGTATTERSNSSLNSGLATNIDLFAAPTQPSGNPLRSALQQYPANNGSLSESQPTAQQSPSATASSTTQTSTNQPFAGGRLQPGQPIPAGILPSPSQITSPPMGSTGYTLPPTLRTVPSSASNSGYGNVGSQPSVPGLPSAPQIAPPVLAPGSVVRSPLQTPVYGNNSGNSANPYNLPSNTAPRPAQREVEVSEPAPFSAPRSVGGGEINTFANP